MHSKVVRVTSPVAPRKRSQQDPSKPLVSKDWILLGGHFFLELLVVILTAITGRNAATVRKARRAGSSSTASDGNDGYSEDRAVSLSAKAHSIPPNICLRLRRTLGRLTDADRPVLLRRSHGCVVADHALGMGVDLRYGVRSSEVDNRAGFSTFLEACAAAFVVPLAGVRLRYKPTGPAEHAASLAVPRRGTGQ